MSSCAFCEELNSNPRICSVVGRDRVIWENDDFMIVPTVGSFVFGYLMLMPKDHTYSFAQLEPFMMNQVPKLAGAICRAILDVLPGINYEVLIAEHGALNCEVKGSQCCDHAHLHFIPVPRFSSDVQGLYMKYGSAGVRDNCAFMDMQKYSTTDYVAHYTYSRMMYVQRLDPHGLIVATGSKFPTQACRVAAASANAVPDKWNWKNFYGEENMQYSIDVFTRYFKVHPPLEVNNGTGDRNTTS